MTSTDRSGRSRVPDPAAAAAYLRRYPLDRVVAAIAARYRTLGRVGGTAEVADPTAAEREALEGFLGRRLTERDWVGAGGAAIRIRVREFADRLRESRYAAELRGALAAYYGEPQPTRFELRNAEEARWRELFAGLLAGLVAARGSLPASLRGSDAMGPSNDGGTTPYSHGDTAPRDDGRPAPDSGGRPAPRDDGRAWLEAVRDGTDPAAPSVRRLLGEQGNLACAATLLAVARALDEIGAAMSDDGSGVAATGPGAAATEPGSGEDAPASAVARTQAPLGNPARLAVFAARMAGDPHAFDPDRPAGRLLLHALEARHRTALAGLDDEPPAIRRGLVLAAAGLMQNGISSTVACYGIELDGVDRTEAGATEAAATPGWPYVSPPTAPHRAPSGLRVIPLRELGRARAAHARGGVVYVVENPPVFEALVDAVDESPSAGRPTLVCTCGFLSVAAIRLLDLLVAGGARLLYSGDFDLNGVRILLGLRRRYGDRLQPWRMDAESYREAQSGSGTSDIPKRMSAVDRGRLREWVAERGGELAPLLEAMAGHGTPAYQESLIRLLLTDVASRRPGVGAAQ